MASANGGSQLKAENGENAANVGGMKM